jgi:S-formylglutathione hydrolase FrmB
VTKYSNEQVMAVIGYVAQNLGQAVGTYQMAKEAAAAGRPDVANFIVNNMPPLWVEMLNHMNGTQQAPVNG